jgi:hypothetical protein
MGVADFLFTPSLQRVLGAALLQPDRSFTLRELLRLVESGRGSAQKQVDRLVEALYFRKTPDEAAKGQKILSDDLTTAEKIIASLGSVEVEPARK